MKPILVLKIEFTRYVGVYFRLPPGGYGTVFLWGTRKWLNPGVWVWHVSLQRTQGAGRTLRVWRSVWRRPLPRLDGPALPGPWERVPRHREAS